MADLTQTAGSVIKGAGARLNTSYTAGEAITAGMPIYLKSSDSKWYKALSANTASAAQAAATAIALNSAAIDQPVVAQEAGTLAIGATVAVGIFYYLSNTAGGICPVADLGSGDFVTIIGYGVSTTSITLALLVTGQNLA